MRNISPVEIASAFDAILERTYHKELQKRLGFGQDADPLTDWERLAIWIYSTAGGGYYSVINTDADTPEIRLVQDILIAAIRKLPTFGGTVYRGMLVTHYELDALLRSTSNGPIRWPRFTSCTIDPELSFGGNVRITIESKTGRILGPYSSSPEEREVLFEPGICFDVRELFLVYEHDKVLYMELGEVCK